MGQRIDKFLDTAGRVADNAVKATESLVARGKDKAEEVALRSRLSKMHRQLGALVYSLRKNGEENEPMIAWYVAEIDRIKAKISALQVPERAVKAEFTVYEDEEQEAEDQEDAMFRDGDV